MCTGPSSSASRDGSRDASHRGASLAGLDGARSGHHTVHLLRLQHDLARGLRDHDLGRIGRMAGRHGMALGHSGMGCHRRHVRGEGLRHAHGRLGPVRQSKRLGMGKRRSDGRQDTPAATRSSPTSARLDQGRSRRGVAVPSTTGERPRAGSRLEMAKRRGHSANALIGEGAPSDPELSGSSLARLEIDDARARTVVPSVDPCFRGRTKPLSVCPRSAEATSPVSDETSRVCYRVVVSVEGAGPSDCS